MRLTTSNTALFALSWLPALVTAVSLSDMTPRAENLPSNCDKIYTSQISGCGVSDFTSQSCSDTCISALQAMVGPIKEACGGQGVTGQNLVVAFLAGVGPQQICPNAGSASSSSAASSVESSVQSSTATSVASTTAAASSVQSTSLLVDTSSAASTARTRTRTPAFSGTTTATSLSEAQSSAPTTSTSDSSSATSTSDSASATSTSNSSEDDGQAAAQSHSGGGSPFDNEGNMFSGADSLSSTSVLVSLGIAVVVCVFLFR